MMKKRAWSYILAITAMIASIVLDMYNPYLIGNIVDKVILQGDFPYLKLALISIGVITIGRAILGYIKE